MPYFYKYGMSSVNSFSRSLFIQQKTETDEKDNLILYVASACRRIRTKRSI
jgi:hypothetical protein